MAEIRINDIVFEGYYGLQLWGDGSHKVTFHCPDGARAETVEAVEGYGLQGVFALRIDDPDLGVFSMNAYLESRVLGHAFGGILSPLRIAGWTLYFTHIHDFNFARRISSGDTPG